MILGIHCSVYQGLDRALQTAVSLGAEAMQMLPYRRHHPPSPAECSAFRAALSKTKIQRLLIHSRFVPNLASKDEAIRKRSIAHLIQELRLAAQLGGHGYVLHAAAYSVGSSFEEGLKLFSESIKIAGREAEGSPQIVLENVPGGGRRMGGALEELAKLVDACPGSGACLDTAHAWAAGYDLASAEGMLKFLARAHRLIGAERVKAFHLNDTRALLGSHRENHEHWGKGFLGKEGLKTLLERPDYAHAVGIHEPPLGSPENDRLSLEFVRRV
ncbi:MAG: deoxyribonuclease IV [Elusimicrobia bacterium]|nr:deoxyribonuclease IV [Elusimicrobiota bacterium]